MTICQKPHRYSREFDELPGDQSFTVNGRHKCAGCAFELGHQLGLNRVDALNIDFS